jgi:hypothetical protein
MRRFVTLCIVLAAGALVAYVGFLSTTRTNTPLEETTQPTTPTERDAASVEFSTTTPHGYEISVRYPSTTIPSVQAFIDDTILKLVDTSAHQFEMYAIRCSNPDKARDINEEYPCSSTDAAIVPWHLSIDYTSFIGEENTAYLFDIYEYTGGAHGSSRYEAFSYNRKTGQEIEFRDLVSATEERDFMSALDRTVRTWFVTEGYGETDINLGTTLPEYGVTTFVTDDGVGVAFSAYALGAYTLGVPVVTVPFTAY